MTNFFRKDLQVILGDAIARHLIFILEGAEELLRTRKRWWIDGTFKIIKLPFVQLFTISGFVTSEPIDGQGNISIFSIIVTVDSPTIYCYFPVHSKMIPLAFVMMSRRRAADYAAVLKWISEFVGNPVVSEMVSDFEIGMWKGVQAAFPDADQVHHYGCGFHWSQAVVRTMRRLRILHYLQMDGQMKVTLQKLMCLPYLPPTQINMQFNILRGEADQRLAPLFAYMDRVWISNSTFRPDNWSCYRRKVRCNNDVEGNHNAWGSDKVI